MINLYSAIDFAAMFIMASFALLIYLGNKTEHTRAYGRYAATCALLAFAFASLMFVDPSHTEIKLLLIRLAYWSGYIIASTYFYFSLVFPSGEERFRTTRYLLLAADLLFLYIYLFTDSIATGFTTGPETYAIAPHNGDLFFELFTLPYLLLVLGALLVFFYKWRHEGDPIRKKQHLLLFALTLVDFFPTTYVAIFLPSTGEVNFIWSAPLLNLTWIVIVSLLIYRTALFKIRIVAGEIFLLILLGILFINIFSKEIDYISAPKNNVSAESTSKN